MSDCSFCTHFLFSYGDRLSPPPSARVLRVIYLPEKRQNTQWTKLKIDRFLAPYLSIGKGALRNFRAVLEASRKFISADSISKLTVATAIGERRSVSRYSNSRARFSPLCTSLTVSLDQSCSSPLRRKWTQRRVIYFDARLQTCEFLFTSKTERRKGIHRNVLGLVW